MTDDVTLRISFSYSDRNGQTCDVCGRYRTHDQFVPNETGDEWFDTFRCCLFCFDAPVSHWFVELTGLGDYDDSWTIWERSRRDGKKEVERILSTTRECVILERHDSPWRVDVRFAGWAPGQRRKRRDSWTGEYVPDAYFLTAYRKPLVQVAA